MCRSIKAVFNFDPPASHAEVREASLQFVRKISGFHTPSRANDVVFREAVDDVAATAEALLGALVTTAQRRNRAAEERRARTRAWDGS